MFKQCGCGTITQSLDGVCSSCSQQAAAIAAHVMAHRKYVSGTVYPEWPVQYVVESPASAAKCWMSPERRADDPYTCPDPACGRDMRVVGFSKTYEPKWVPVAPVAHGTYFENEEKTTCPWCAVEIHSEKPKEKP